MIRWLFFPPINYNSRWHFEKKKIDKFKKRFVGVLSGIFVPDRSFQKSINTNNFYPIVRINSTLGQGKTTSIRRTRSHGEDGRTEKKKKKWFRDLWDFDSRKWQIWNKPKDILSQWNVEFWHWECQNLECLRWLVLVETETQHHVSKRISNQSYKSSRHGQTHRASELGGRRSVVGGRIAGSQQLGIAGLSRSRLGKWVSFTAWVTKLVSGSPCATR